MSLVNNGVTRQLTGRMRWYAVGTAAPVLQQEWVSVTWPHEPYREKGEEIYTHVWIDVPTESET